MRHLIAAIAGVVLVSASAVGAQVKMSDERSGNTCEKFKIGIVTPSADVDYKLKVITPPADVDYKMRILNPCRETNLVVATDPAPIPHKHEVEFQLATPRFNIEPDKKAGGPAVVLPPYRHKP